MIKVGKILGIMEIFLIFFDFGWGFWIFGSTRSTRISGAWWGLALASFSECSECSECSDDKKVWGVGVGIFLLVVWVFFVNLQKCYGSFF